MQAGGRNERWLTLLGLGRALGIVVLWISSTLDVVCRVRRLHCRAWIRCAGACRDKFSNGFNEKAVASHQGLSAKSGAGRRRGTFRRAVFRTVYRISDGSWRAVRLLDFCQMNVGRILCQRARLALNRISPARLGQPSLVSSGLPGPAQIFNEQDRRCWHMNNAKSDNERQPSGRRQTGYPQAHGAAGTSHDDKHDVSYCSTRRPFREPWNFGMGIAHSDNQQRGNNERPSHHLSELSRGNAADSHSLPRVVISR